MQKGGQIFDLGIPGGGSGSASVASPVVANGMELLAEIRPYVVPHRRVGNSIVDENHRFRTRSTLLEEELRPLDLDERSGAGILAGACDLRDGLTTYPEYQHERAMQHRVQRPSAHSFHASLPQRIFLRFIVLEHTVHRIFPIARARIARRFSAG